VPRGSKIKSGWIYGLVVYTGMDTKIMQGNFNNKSKSNFLERVVNMFFICSVFLVIVTSIISIIVLVAKRKD